MENQVICLLCRYVCSILDSQFSNTRQRAFARLIVRLAYSGRSPINGFA